MKTFPTPINLPHTEGTELEITWFNWKNRTCEDKSSFRFVSNFCFIFKL